MTSQNSCMALYPNSTVRLSDIAFMQWFRPYWRTVPCLKLNTLVHETCIVSSWDTFFVSTDMDFWPTYSSATSRADILCCHRNCSAIPALKPQFSWNKQIKIIKETTTGFGHGQVILSHDYIIGALGLAQGCGLLKLRSLIFAFRKFRFI